MHTLGLRRIILFKITHVDRCPHLGDPKTSIAFSQASSSTSGSAFLEKTGLSEHLGSKYLKYSCAWRVSYVIQTKGQGTDEIEHVRERVRNVALANLLFAFQSTVDVATSCFNMK